MEPSGVALNRVFPKRGATVRDMNDPTMKLAKSLAILFPLAIYLWNCLPEGAVSTSDSEFFKVFLERVKFACKLLLFQLYTQ